MEVLSQKDLESPCHQEVICTCGRKKFLKQVAFWIWHEVTGPKHDRKCLLLFKNHGNSCIHCIWIILIKCFFRFRSSARSATNGSTKSASQRDILAYSFAICVTFDDFHIQFIILLLCGETFFSFLAW